MVVLLAVELSVSCIPTVEGPSFERSAQRRLSCRLSHQPTMQSDSNFAVAVGFDGMLDLLDDEVADDMLPAEELALPGGPLRDESIFMRAGLNEEKRDFEWTESLALQLPKPEDIPSFEEEEASPEDSAPSPGLEAGAAAPQPPSSTGSGT